MMAGERAGERIEEILRHIRRIVNIKSETLLWKRWAVIWPYKRK
jgi:hypothetical protein